MEALAVNPLSIVAKTSSCMPSRSVSPSKISVEPNKDLSLPSNNQYCPCVFSASTTLRGSLVLLSSFLTSELAKALTYDEALQQSAGSSFTLDFDVGGFLDSAISFAAENPIIVGGGAAAVAVPLAVAQLLSKAKSWGVESAKAAYAKLGDDANAQLLDIRAAAELKKVGSPDIRSLKKKPVAVVYKDEDKTGFLKRLSFKFKEPENTTLFILDKFDGSSELVAELVTSNGFKAAYAIKDGAEGSRGWMNSGLPWMLPKRNLDLSSLTDAIGDAFGEASDAVPVALGIAAAAAGLGLLAFTEVETILQILGSAALVQFASKKLLFAEDRKQTIQQIEELLNTKVAPKELVEDIQQIGKVLLPLPANDELVPTPAESTPAPSESTVLKLESTNEVPDVQPKAEEEVEEESLPRS